MTTTESATDWTPIRVVDAMALDPGTDAACDRCGRPLRWVHVLRNEHGWFARVGCCCAIRLTGGAYDAKGAERRATNRATRWLRFSNSQKWKPSRNNTENVCRTVILSGGTARVTIFSKHGRYGVYVARSKGSEVTPFERFGDRAAAMRFAFEVIEGLRTDRS